MTSCCTWRSPAGFGLASVSRRGYRIDVCRDDDDHWLVQLHGEFITSGSAAVIRGVLGRVGRARHPLHVDARNVTALGPAACAELAAAVVAPAPYCPVVLDAASPVALARLAEVAEHHPALAVHPALRSA